MSPEPNPTATAVAGSIVESLKAQPILLVVVLLNIVMCATAAWFLNKQEGYRHSERMALLERCPPQPLRSSEATP
jgi:hypothetical protein